MDDLFDVFISISIYNHKILKIALTDCPKHWPPIIYDAYKFQNELKFKNSREKTNTSSQILIV